MSEGSHFLSLSTDDDVVVESVKRRLGGHIALLGGQSPRTLGLRNDLVQIPHFAEEDDGAKTGEVKGNYSCAQEAFPECQALFWWVGQSAGPHRYCPCSQGH